MKRLAQYYVSHNCELVKFPLGASYSPKFFVPFYHAYKISRRLAREILPPEHSIARMYTMRSNLKYFTQFPCV